ncbi:MAG: SDR family NAD(P)-dependent oxidoreductase, partial [Rhodospirillaceae bacterium]
PTQQRSKDRAEAEEKWLDLWRETDAPVHLFRLAGIYGPGRSAFDQIAAGRAKRLIKPGQVFSRIHVDDIARVVFASMRARDPGAIYNVCDDEPVPPQDVVTHACALLGIEPPPEQPFDADLLTPMAASFYADNRRVRNDRLIEDLKVELRYPTYREGLAAILKELPETPQPPGSAPG